MGGVCAVPIGAPEFDPDAEPIDAPELDPDAEPVDAPEVAPVDDPDADPVEAPLDKEGETGLLLLQAAQKTSEHMYGRHSFAIMAILRRQRNSVAFLRKTNVWYAALYAPQAASLHLRVLP